MIGYDDQLSDIAIIVGKGHLTNIPWEFIWGNHGSSLADFGDTNHIGLILSSISGWWYTYPSEKYEFVSWDYEIPNIWKNRKNRKCSKPPTRYGLSWIMGNSSNL